MSGVAGPLRLPSVDRIVAAAGVALRRFPEVGICTREIKGIPVSLLLVGVVTFMGPWSAYSVAEGSQVRRLAGILTEHGALAEGRITPDTTVVPFEEWDQAEAVVRYLVQHHGTSALDSWAELVLDMAGERWSARVSLRSLTLGPRAEGGFGASAFAVDAVLLRASGPPP